MNADTVAQWLDAIGVPPEVVSVGAENDNAWCLLRIDPDPDTEPGAVPEWEVFWREHGNRYDWARFSNEHVACYYLFGRLAWTQTASGALRPAWPDGRPDQALDEPDRQPEESPTATA